MPCSTKLAFSATHPSTKHSTLVSCTHNSMYAMPTISRYVLGHEAMQKMSSADVLFIGLGGLGLEIGMIVSEFI